MTARPSRAKMCNWLAGSLRGVHTRPSNPADIRRLSELSIIADRKLHLLAGIASELGWHADASLDFAWDLIREYDNEFGGPHSDPYRRADA